MASKFIRDGYAAMRDPHVPAPAEETTTDTGVVGLAARLPLLPEDPKQLVRLQGAVQLGAGVLLALGRAPRLASAALAVTLIPTTLASFGHRTARDPDESAFRRGQFSANVSLLGGLLIAAADTHGKPSFAFRTRRTAGHVSDTVGQRTHDAADRIAGVTDTAVNSVTSSVAAARKRLP